MRYINQLMIVLIFSVIVVGMVYSQSATTTNEGTETTKNTSTTGGNKEDTDENGRFLNVKDNTGMDAATGNFGGELNKDKAGGFSVNNFNGEMTTKDGTKVSGSADQVLVDKDGKVIVKGLKSGGNGGGTNSSTSGSLTTKDGTNISGSADTVTIDKNNVTTIEGFKGGDFTLKNETYNINGKADKIEINEKGGINITNFSGEYTNPKGNKISGAADRLEISNDVVYFSNGYLTVETSKDKLETVNCIKKKGGSATTIDSSSNVIISGCNDDQYLKIDVQKGAFSDYNNKNSITVTEKGNVGQFKAGSSNYMNEVQYYSKGEMVAYVDQGTFTEPKNMVKDDFASDNMLVSWVKNIVNTADDPEKDSIDLLSNVLGYDRKVHRVGDTVEKNGKIYTIERNKEGKYEFHEI